MGIDSACCGDSTERMLAVVYGRDSHTGSGSDYGVVFAAELQRWISIYPAVTRDSERAGCVRRLLRASGK